MTASVQTREPKNSIKPNSNLQVAALKLQGTGQGRYIRKDQGGYALAWRHNFDLTNEFNILRLICGLFFIPHIYAKFFVPEALGFFKAAKLNPPAVWMYTACVIESSSPSG